uniref:Dolichyl-phosphate beta-glucosyltransferase n=1 Tax=Culicoides sonorensis TaxID=179676 RepID=A0A336MEJ0_CULSO
MDFVEFLQVAFIFGSLSFVCLFITLLVVLRLISTPYPIIKRHDKEKYFTDPVTGQTEPFPSLEDEPSVELIPLMLDEALEFLEDKFKQTSSFKYEIIIVSDGSKDKTVEVGLEYSKRFGTQKVRVLELIENRGKGGAVRLGILSARGKYLLFADADGATKFSDYKKLETIMWKLVPDWRNDAVVIGSRAHLEKDAIAQRSFFRTILMHGFHLLVWIFAVRKVRDTQCGFKLMTRSAAKSIFYVMHVERWAFDVEMLHIAQTYRMPLEEVAVNWTEIDGSKVTPFWSWLQMGRDLILIWLKYTINVTYNLVLPIKISKLMI